MMARRSMNCTGTENGDEIGCKLTGSAAGNRAHLHMPWCRKMLSPLRTSAGSGTPSMAERSLS